MKPRLLVPLALSALLAAPGARSAHAQDGTAADFCALEPGELLQALDGVWSVKQGAGRAGGAAIVPHPETGAAIAGMIGLMLREKDPVDLELEYHPNVGFSVLSGQGQSMIMVPADRERAAEEIRLQREERGESAGDATGNCGGGSLPPVLVGTNDYLLVDDGGSDTPREYRETDLPGVGIAVGYCTDDPLFGILDVFSTDEDYASSDPEVMEDRCGSVEDRPPREPGTMRMTILARFDSPRSGSGYLYFDGEIDGVVFGATAELTLSR